MIFVAAPQQPIGVALVLLAQSNCNTGMEKENGFPKLVPNFTSSTHYAPIHEIEYMSKINSSIILLMVIFIALPAVVAYLLGWIDPLRLQGLILSAGAWAPLLYVGLYVVATSLLLPSTPLNISGGLLFGLSLGMLWTGIAAVVAAAMTFAFARTLGQTVIRQKMVGRWQAMDAEVRRGAKLYMFAVRLLPVLPNGLVNYSAGVVTLPKIRAIEK
jgi:uncharacterized membrane protein YdjX (TVP38/TMEM64 family)